ncbi:MAG: NTP transferase domain-containing protein [Candidatus Cloacimonadota bacterium]|nr:NTP transferase domain-containing protein [Candidatus Cloacimonadota bacterium]
MIEGIVLVAGYSSRAGGMKMTFEINGKPLLEHTLQPMLQFCHQIWVVTGYEKELIETIVAKFSKVQTVYNSNFHRGMFSSVQTGVNMITSSNFFLTPGDIPFVRQQTYQALLEKGEEVVIPTFKGRKGHPVLMKRILKDIILSEPQDSNLRNVLHKFKPNLVEVEDKAILKDVDTKEDYKKLYANFRKDSR